MVVPRAFVFVLDGNAVHQCRYELFGLPSLLFPHQGNHYLRIHAFQDLPGTVHPVFAVLGRTHGSIKVCQRFGDAAEEPRHELAGGQPVLRVLDHGRHHCGGVHARQHVSYAGEFVLGYSEIILLLDGGDRGAQQDGSGRARLQAAEHRHLFVQGELEFEQDRHVQAVRSRLDLDAGALVGI